MEKTRANEIQAFKTMRLTESEKGTMLNALLSHIEKNPIVEPAPLIRSPFYIRIWSDSLLKQRASYALALVLVAVVAGGGTVSAAEGALPGDFLYSVKINVSEPVRTALTFNTAAQARWESEKAERRLQEAEALAKVGRLSTKVREQIQNQITGNIEAFGTFTKILAQEGSQNEEAARDAHVTLQAKVTAHSKILERVQAKTPTRDQIEVKRLELGVRESAENIPSVSTQNTPTLSTKEKNVNDLILKTRAALEAEQPLTKPGLQAEILSDTHAALETAEAALGEAKAGQAAGNDSSAYEAFIHSQRAALEAATSLEQAFKLK